MLLSNVLKLLVCKKVAIGGSHSRRVVEGCQ